MAVISHCFQIVPAGIERMESNFTSLLLKSDEEHLGLTGDRHIIHGATRTFKQIHGLILL